MAIEEQMKKMRYKDASNERILKKLAELEKVMDAEGRGWIFAPVVQNENDHRCLGYAKFKHPDEFWATIGMLVIEINKQLPEDDRPEFRNGFYPFIQMVAHEAFPMMRFEPQED